ncbi:MAG: hypothetical protein J0651_00415 [Actinobacteria bacterium]|nr:hypothetical protein [Actinomycetota bacterium]
MALNHDTEEYLLTNEALALGTAERKRKPDKMKWFSHEFRKVTVQEASNWIKG